MKLKAYKFDKNLADVHVSLKIDGVQAVSNTDTIRQELADNLPIGKTIEVEVMELTPTGKFRHPRFMRLRPDKD